MQWRQAGLHRNESITALSDATTRWQIAVFQRDIPVGSSHAALDRPEGATSVDLRIVQGRPDLGHSTGLDGQSGTSGQEYQNSRAAIATHKELGRCRRDSGRSMPSGNGLRQMAG